MQKKKEKKKSNQIKSKQISCTWKVAIIFSLLRDFTSWPRRPAAHPCWDCTGGRASPSLYSQWSGRRWRTACSPCSPRWRAGGGSWGQRLWTGSRCRCTSCSTCRSWCTSPRRLAPPPGRCCPALRTPRSCQVLVRWHPEKQKIQNIKNFKYTAVFWPHFYNGETFINLGAVTTKQDTDDYFLTP